MQRVRETICIWSPLSMGVLGVRILRWCGASEKRNRMEVNHFTIIAIAVALTYFLILILQFVINSKNNENSLRDNIKSVILYTSHFLSVLVLSYSPNKSSLAKILNIKRCFSTSVKVSNFLLMFISYHHFE